MPKRVSSSEAKATFGTLLKWMNEHDDEVIVELYNKPAAVMMSYEEYEEVLKLREKARRQKAWEALETLRQQISERNADLSQAEAYRLAGFGEAVIDEMLAAERKAAT